MNSIVIAGLLYLIVFIAGILSYLPVIDDSNFLSNIHINQRKVIFGALSQFVLSFAYVGIAVLLFPTLSSYNEEFSLGFVSFRVIASILNILAIVIIFLLLDLSQEFSNSDSPDTVYFQTLGNLLRTGRDFMNHVVMILALSIGGLMFYYILFQSQLIPQWLSIWGFIGALLSISASFLLMFKLTTIKTRLYLGLNVPMALQEIVLGIWLITIGLNP
ncbi:MAG: DUF4386 domain-containing protein [Candidatus Hodarchaeales archaeon]|jgi:hypothetical protein